MSKLMIFKKQNSMSSSRMTRSRSKSLANMPNLRDIAMDSSLVMLAFLNTEGPQNRLRFNEPLSLSFKGDQIPQPLLELLRYFSHEGIMVPDVFRRPGNTTEQKRLIKRLTEGKTVKFSEYNFYTLASVIKRFLLCIPGGVLGQELEEKALAILYLDDIEQQLETLNGVLSCLAKSVQQFLTLLFGVWYMISTKHHIHKMTSEAMAKSVTGSIFPNATSDPLLVNNAAKVMQIMIENFYSVKLFGEENLEFFSLIMQTRKETHDSTTDNCQSTADTTLDLRSKSGHCSPELRLKDHDDMLQSVNKYEDLRSRQLDRLKQRADWFLNPRSLESSPTTMGRRHKAYGTRKTIACVPIRPSEKHEYDESENNENDDDDDDDDDDDREGMDNKDIANTVSSPSCLTNYNRQYLYL